jgi:hypothetical protein
MDHPTMRPHQRLKDVVLVTKRLQTLGVVLAVIGLGFLAGAGVAYA